LAIIFNGGLGSNPSDDADGFHRESFLGNRQLPIKDMAVMIAAKKSRRNCILS
jgi:hypothetical protein